MNTAYALPATVVTRGWFGPDLGMLQVWMPSGRCVLIRPFVAMDDRGDFARPWPVDPPLFASREPVVQVQPEMVQAADAAGVDINALVQDIVAAGPDVVAAVQKLKAGGFTYETIVDVAALIEPDFLKIMADVFAARQQPQTPAPDFGG